MSLTRTGIRILLLIEKNMYHVELYIVISIVAVI